MTKGKKLLNMLLLVSFFITIMVPLTGIHIHKAASALFLLLCIIHTAVYRRKLGARRYLLLSVILFSFLSGLLGMIWTEYPLMLQMHRAVSIGTVFFLAIHIFIYHKGLR